MTLSDSESGHSIFEQRIPVAGDRKVLDPRFMLVSADAGHEHDNQ
jgi:hypothetical protein